MFNETTLAVCRDLAVLCLDLARELDFDREDFYDHIHTTPSGSRKIGDYLYDRLKTVLAAPRPPRRPLSA